MRGPCRQHWQNVCRRYVLDVSDLGGGARGDSFRAMIRNSEYRLAGVDQDALSALERGGALAGAGYPCAERQAFDRAPLITAPDQLREDEPRTGETLLRLHVLSSPRSCWASHSAPIGPSGWLAWRSTVRASSAVRTSPASIAPTNAK